MGLVKELEYKAGAVWPHQRRVIEMPVAVGDESASAAPGDAPAPVIGIRAQSITDSRMGKLVGLTILVGVVGSVVAVSLFREGPLRPRMAYGTGDQGYLELTHEDDYYAVVRKLGQARGKTTGSRTRAPSSFAASGIPSAAISSS